MMEKEFVDYVKQRRYLHRMMEGLKAQYIRLGRLGGRITIPKATKKEKEALELLLNTSVIGEDITFTYRQLETRMKETKFGDLNFITILELYFDKKIFTNAMIKQELQNQKIQAYQTLATKFIGTKAWQWLLYCKEHNVLLYNTCIKTYITDTEKLELILEAINRLPYVYKQVESLSIFANTITKNPHFFDKGFPSTILLDALCYLFDYEKYNLTLQQKNEVFLKAGLIKEENLNYCMVSHIYAMRNQKYHEGIAYFSSRYESMNLHLGNIIKIDRIIKVTYIIVIENPSVFQEINTFIKERHSNTIGLLCTNGELNFASYVLLDKVAASKIPMLYCGDFDPEGLLIADKLKQRYKEKLSLWCYQKEHYEIAKSLEVIDDIRCLKLQHCNSKELQEIKDILLTTKRAGYQESLLSCYKEEITKLEKK